MTKVTPADIYYLCSNVNVYPTLKFYDYNAWQRGMKKPQWVFKDCDPLNLPDWAYYGKVEQFEINDDGSITFVLEKVETPG